MLQFTPKKRDQQKNLLGKLEQVLQELDESYLRVYAKSDLWKEGLKLEDYLQSAYLHELHEDIIQLKRTFEYVRELE